MTQMSTTEPGFEATCAPSLTNDDVAAIVRATIAALPQVAAPFEDSARLRRDLRLDDIDVLCVAIDLEERLVIDLSGDGMDGVDTVADLIRVAIEQRVDRRD